MSNDTKKTENTEMTVVTEEKKLKLGDKIKQFTDKIPAPVKTTVKTIGKIIVAGLTILGAIDVGCSIKEAVGNKTEANDDIEEIDGSVE